MRLLKFIGKILIFPVILAVTVIQWMFTFLVGFSSIIFNLLAGLFFLAAVASYILGLTPGLEALKMITVGFVIFMIPIIGQGIIAIVVMIREGLCDFIRS